MKPIKPLGISVIDSATTQQINENLRQLAIENGPYKVTADYTFRNSDTIDSLQVDATAGNVTITLPSSTGNRRRRIVKVDSSINTVTIVAGSYLINLQTTHTLTFQFDQLWVEPTGTGWIILSPEMGFIPAWVDVRWFGAKGDGITDDTIALNNVFTTVAAGSKIIVPTGTYIISSNLVITKSLYIYGNGMNKTIIHRTTGGASTYAFYITASNVELKDFSVRGPAAAAYVTNEIGIYAYGTTGTHLSNIIISSLETYNFGSDGITLEYVDNFHIAFCYLHDCGYAGAAVISSTKGTVTNNRISTITPGTSGNAYGAYASQRTDGDSYCQYIAFSSNQVKDITVWEGLDTHGGRDIIFSDNIITNCFIGINVSPAIAPTSSNLPERIVISGNSIYAGGHSDVRTGIIVGGQDASNTAKTIVLANNIVDSMGNDDNRQESAVYLQYITGLSISGGVIKNSRATALNLFDAISNFVITGLIIDGVQAGNASATGILLGEGTTNLIGHIGEVVIDSSAEYAITFSSAERGVTWGSIKYITSNAIPIVNATNAGEGFVLYGTLTAYDFASIAHQSYDWQNITVTGAEIGDFVTVASSIDLAKLCVSAYVSATNNVVFTLYNLTGGNVNLGSADYTAKVVKTQR